MRRNTGPALTATASCDQRSGAPNQDVDYYGQMPTYGVHIAIEALMTRPASALELVGGAAVIGGEVGPGIDMIKLIRRGLPVGAVQFVLDSGRLTLAEIDQIVLPRKTLANRRKLGNLTPEQSDRLVRVARVLAAAEETFGNQEKAGAWLRRPTRALGGEAPLNLLDTDGGTREVETLLGRIGYGIAA
jgi:putative toxin-antitoxin system antitoxin component (TIGR02293 family)